MEQPRKTQVIAVGNQKGGVGKTTSAVHIAAALGERGRLCLLWDLDMNHNATKQFGVPPDSFLGTFEVLIGAEKAVDVVLKPGEVEGVDLPSNVHLIPSKRKLEAIGQVLAEQDKFQAPQDILLEPLRSLAGFTITSFSTRHRTRRLPRWRPTKRRIILSCRPSLSLGPWRDSTMHSRTSRPCSDGATNG